MTTGQAANEPQTTRVAPQADAKLARALLRSLTRGTAIARGARLIHVGHEAWLTSQAELLREIAEDGYSDTKFVRGAYGAGKSHFLAMVQEGAREQGWITSHIECHFDRVEIDRFETLYPALIRKLSARDFYALSSEDDAEQPEPIRVLLEKWTDRQFTAVGLRSDAHTRPFDGDTRLFAYLAKRLLRGAVPANFARALTAFAMATLTGDMDSQNAICAWLGATNESALVPNQYLRRESKVIGKVDARASKPVELKPISAGTVHDAMRGLLWLVKDAGYAGLVLCIDEVEELSRLGSRKRQDRALQALRDYVDHAGGDDSYKWLCMYLAATPEMFDGEEYFPRYDALASRIQAVSEHVNWRAPVVDLDRTPLGPQELQIIASKIRDLYRLAHGNDSAHSLTDDTLKLFVSGISETKVRMARPRLLARIMIDELDRARSIGERYAPPERVDKVISRAADALRKGEEK